MKVQDLMAREPVAVRRSDDLAAAARRMWDGDFGILPVVDEEHRVIGVITDRDICMALAIQDRRPSEMRVDEVMSEDVHACRPDDLLDSAIGVMREYQVHRLPVTDPDRVLRGMVSINDLAVSMETTRSRSYSGPTYSEVAKLLQAVSRHRQPQTA